MTDNHSLELPRRNSTYANLSLHWKLDSTGQPTQEVFNARCATDIRCVRAKV